MNKIKAILNWIGVDGFLHFISCYAMMLTLAPIIGMWWALTCTTIVALIKEAIDYFIQKCSKEESIHELMMDAIGIATAYITFLLWWLI